MSPKFPPLCRFVCLSVCLSFFVYLFVFLSFFVFVCLLCRSVRLPVLSVCPSDILSCLLCFLTIFGIFPTEVVTCRSFCYLTHSVTIDTVFSLVTTEPAESEYAVRCISSMRASRSIWQCWIRYNSLSSSSQYHTAFISNDHFMIFCFLLFLFFFFVYFDGYHTYLLHLFIYFLIYFPFPSFGLSLDPSPPSLILLPVYPDPLSLPKITISTGLSALTIVAIVLAIAFFCLVIFVAILFYR